MTGKSATPWLLAMSTLLASSIAVAGTGKLVLTGGITSIEGSAGGGISPWATIGTQATEREWGASASSSFTQTDDYRLNTYGVAAAWNDRVELSLGQQRLDTGITGDRLMQPGLVLQQNIIGAKVRVLGDAILDSDTWVPQVSVAKLLRSNLAVGIDRAMPNNLARAGQAAGLGNGLAADDWKDIFIAWAPHKQLSLTAAYVDLGRIVPATTNNRDQTGFFVAAQFAFGSSPRSDATKPSSPSKSGWSCSSTENALQPLARAHIAIGTQRLTQAIAIKLLEPACRARPDSRYILSQLICIVEQIHKQELRRQGMREPGLHPEIELAIAQPEVPMPLAVVDHRAVIELRGAQPDRVVSRGRKEQEVIIPQEGAYQLGIVRWQLAEHGLAGRVVEPLRQLPQITRQHQRLEVSINRGGHSQQVGASVHTPRLQNLPDLL